MSIASKGPCPLVNLYFNDELIVFVLLISLGLLNKNRNSKIIEKVKKYLGHIFISQKIAAAVIDLPGFNLVSLIKTH